MLSHRIDLADVGAGTEQRPRHRLLIGERQALDRRDPVGRCAAGQKHQHEIVPARAIRQGQRALGGFKTGGVRDRMAGLDHRDGPGRPAIALPRHGNAREPAGRQIGVGRLGRFRHGTGGLAGAEHDHPAGPRRRGQMGWQAECRVRCCDCSAKQPVQKRPCRHDLAVPILYRTARLPTRTKPVIMLPKKEFLGREYAGTCRLYVKIKSLRARAAYGGRHASTKAKGGVRDGVRFYGQWQGTKRRCRRQHAVALGGARAPETHRHQIRLRRRPVRRLHGPRRWQGGALLPDHDVGGRGQEGHHHRGAVADHLASTAEGLDCRAGAAMRLLPVRPDHAGRRTAGEQQDANARADRRPHGRQHLPLRHL